MKNARPDVSREIHLPFVAIASRGSTLRDKETHSVALVLLENTLFPRRHLVVRRAAKDINNRATDRPLANVAFPVNTPTRKERRIAKFVLPENLRRSRTHSDAKQLPTVTCRTPTKLPKCLVPPDLTLSEPETTSAPNALREKRV